MKQGHDVLIESLHDKYLKPLKNLLSKKNNRIMEVSLLAKVQICIQRDAMRKHRKYGKKVIKEVHATLSFRRGLIIDVSNKTTKQVLKEIQSKINL